MPLNLRDYDPVLYHITAKANLTSIRLERKLYSKRRSFLDQRAIAYRGSALHEGHAKYTGGWCFADLDHALTERVFFWPENRMGTYGKRFFNVADDAMLRVSFQELLKRNPSAVPFFRNCDTAKKANRWCEVWS
jgi:hypothetical protein